MWWPMRAAPHRSCPWNLCLCASEICMAAMKSLLLRRPGLRCSWRQTCWTCKLLKLYAPAGSCCILHKTMEKASLVMFNDQSTVYMLGTAVIFTIIVCHVCTTALLSLYLKSKPCYGDAVAMSLSACWGIDSWGILIWRYVHFSAVTPQGCTSLDVPCCMHAVNCALHHT